MSSTQTIDSRRAGDTDALIEIEGLKKYFTENDSWLTRLHPRMEVQRVHAVDGVNMTIERGETRGLVGESGCGKSTLARLVTRLLKPSSGSIYIDDEDIARKDGRALKAFRKKVQIIFQDPFSSLNPRYTIRRALTEPMTVHDIGESKRERNARAADLIEQVGLDPEHLDRYPHEFSGGQRQRIGIARALAVDPEILIADEPTSALDVSIQADILKMIDEIQAERNLTILFISHDLSVVRYISDKISVMYLGEVIETAPADDLFADPKHPYSQMLLSSIPSPDPKNRTEFVAAKGEVPDPINPPSGCRFHTRCPEVIQPASLSLEQEVWRDIFQFKKDLANENVLIDNVRADVEEKGYDRYIADEFGSDLDSNSEQTLHAALRHVIDDERERAVAELDGVFTSPCETETPASYEIEDRTVNCHLHGEYTDA